MFGKKEKKQTKKKEINKKSENTNEIITDVPKKKKKNQKDTPKSEKINLKKIDIHNIIPFAHDDEKHMFKDKDGNYLMMVRTVGTNLFGFKDSDKMAYINAFSRVFNRSIGEGQLYSYMIGADVDSYVADFQYFKDNLNMDDDRDVIRYDILDEAQKRLKYTALTKELVDRCFVFILKGKDIFQLEQRCKEIVSALGSYQKTFILDFTDTFLVLYNYYHPQQSKMFTEMAKEADDIIDFLCPTRIGLVDTGYKQCVELDGIYCRTKYLRDYKKGAIFALMSYLATAGDIDFSMHFKPAQSDVLTKAMDKKLNNIEKNMQKAKEASTQAKLQSEYAETQEMVNKVSADGDEPVDFAVFLRIKGTDIKTVRDISKDLDDTFASFGLRFDDGVFEPLEMFNLSAPICYDYYRKDSFCKTTQVPALAWMYPFVFEALYDSTPLNNHVNYPPVYIGNTIQTNGVVFYDNFTKKDDRSNYNEFVVGKSGMGKTFYMMWLIYNRCGLGYKQYVIDVEGKELNKLTYYLGGVNIDCSNGEKGRINPLHIRFNVPDSDTGDGKVPLSEIYPMEQHIRFLRSFLNAYKGDSDEIGILHNNLIEKAIIEVYKNVGIDFKTDAEYISNNFKNEDYPIFSDVYDMIAKWLKELQIENNNQDSAEIERYKVCLAFLEPIAYGADANLFNGHTNVDLSSNLINFNISALQDNTGSRVLATQYYNILSYIWTDIISDSGNNRKQLYADEFSVIMDPRYLDIMMYFQTVIKRVRKYMAGFTSATQQVSDVLKDSVREQGEAIIENSVYQFFFGLGTEGIEYFKKTNLIPESEQEFVQFANIGECYAKIGTSTAMRIHIQISDNAFNIFRSLKDDAKNG